MMKNNLKIPSFKREECNIGIVHLGVGNFHRAHQALYINNYLNETNDLNWGICGINLREEERENFNFLHNRDGKYVLKTISTEGDTEFTEIHSIKKLVDIFVPKYQEIIVQNPTWSYLKLVALENKVTLKYTIFKKKNNILEIKYNNILSNLNTKTKMIYLSSPNIVSGQHINKKEFDDFITKIPDNILILLDQRYIVLKYSNQKYEIVSFLFGLAKRVNIKKDPN